MKKFVPFLDRILIKPSENDPMTKSKKLYTAEGTGFKKNYEARRGEVLAIGPGAFNSFSGNWVKLTEEPYNFKVGDVVLYPHAASVEVRVEGEIFYTLSATDIYGKIEDSDTVTEG